VIGITPNVGSDRGGSWGTITGTDFIAGAIVMLGSSRVYSTVENSTSIKFSPTAAHAPGSVDVVVTNPGGRKDTLARGYTFAPQDTFDFNGEWNVQSGSEFEIPMRFTIRQNRITSVSCNGVAVALLATPEVRGPEFSLGGDAGVTMTGTLVSPVSAVGTIDVAPCGPRWWANKAP
jgi:hypothetical protein